MQSPIRSHARPQGLHGRRSCLGAFLGLFISVASLSCTGPAQTPSCTPDSLLAGCRERCQGDGDCLAPARCNPSLQTCIIPAIACDPLSGTLAIPTANGSQANCPSHKECDLVTRTCIPRPGAHCASDGECRLGESCNDATCSPVATSSQCTRDSDCLAPDVCRLTLIKEQLIALCGPPIGPSPAGARCKDNGECQSGLCLRTGVCFGGCLPGDPNSIRTDCHNHDGVICAAIRLLLRPDLASAPRPFIVSGCVLSPPACQRDRDCDSTGTICQPLIEPDHPDTLRTGCLPALGLLRGSVSCQSDADCASGLCAGDPRTCFAACQMDSDCRPMPAMPPALICRTAFYIVEGIGSPLTSCVLGP